MRLKLLTATLLLILSSFFIASSPINTQKANALPSSACAFDLYYILDLSGSMSDNISGGGGSKLNAMKNKVTELNSTLALLNSNTQVGFTAFKGRNTNAPLPDTFEGSYERRWLTNDIPTINGFINSLSAFDGTPLPGAINHAIPGMRYQGREDNIPVAILISDGVPTVGYTVADSHSSTTGWRTYNVDAVSAVNIKDGNGNFLTPEQVEVLGTDSMSPYQNPHIAGEILAATMRASLQVENLSGKPQIAMGLFLDGPGVDRPDIIEHFGTINNGNNFFNISTADQILNTVLSLLDESCNDTIPETGAIKINLPPKSVYTPDEMLLEGQIFSFNGTQFSPRIHNDGFIKVDTTTITESGIESYEINISGLRKGEAIGYNSSRNITAFNKFINSFSAKAYTPPPATNVLLLGPALFDIKMTFDEIATRSTLGSLSRQIGSYPYALLGDANCASSTAPTHMCFKTKVSAVNFSDTINGQLYLTDSVEMDFPGTITVEGNVLATETIGGFTLPSGGNQNWLAVGGNIEAAVSDDDNLKLENYLNSGSKLLWDNGVGQKLIDKKNTGIEVATEFPADPGQATTTFTGGNFNLNAPGTNPRAAGESSFSSGPDGKVWYNGSSNSSVTFNNVNISGVGTLVVRGNLVVNGALTCSSGARFGVIATGSVVFNTADIECGAYIALGEVNSGDVAFNTNVGVNKTAKGIFIAKGSIELPSVSPGSDYTISYDIDFALEPSALFKDILKIVFTTSS